MRRLKKCSGRSTKLRKSPLRKDVMVIGGQCGRCLEDDGGGGRDEDDDDKNAYFSFSQFSLVKVYNHSLLEEYLHLISQLSTLHERPSYDEFSVLWSDRSSPCWSNLLTKIVSRTIPNSTDCP